VLHLVLRPARPADVDAANLILRPPPSCAAGCNGRAGAICLSSAFRWRGPGGVQAMPPATRWPGNQLWDLRLGTADDRRALAQDSAPMCPSCLAAAPSSDLGRGEPHGALQSADLPIACPLGPVQLGVCLLQSRTHGEASHPLGLWPLPRNCAATSTWSGADIRERRQTCARSLAGRPVAGATISRPCARSQSVGGPEQATRAPGPGPACARPMARWGLAMSGSGPSLFACLRDFKRRPEAARASWPEASSAFGPFGSGVAA